MSQPDKIADILSKYREIKTQSPQGTNVELEIRFKEVTKEVFTELYEKLSKDSEFSARELDCTINVINKNVFERSNISDSMKYIKQYRYKNGISIKPINYYTKESIKQVFINDYINYGISIAKETPFDQFDAEANAMVRFKIRVSFDLVGKPAHDIKWRFDLTAVRSGLLSSFGSSMTTIRDELFKPGMTSANIMEKLDLNSINGYEAEIEYVGADFPSVEDMSVVRKFFSLISSNYMDEMAYHEEIYNVAKHIIENKEVHHLYKHKYGLKRLVNQARSLTKNIYYTSVYPADGWFVTDKADGQRCVVVLEGNRCRLLTHTLHEKVNTDTTTEITIAEGELLGDINNPKTYHLMLFDCMVINGSNVCDQGFEIRMGHLPKIADMVSSYGFQCSAKKFLRAEQDRLKECFGSVLGAKYEYTTDGIILTKPGDSYHSTINYKWKPASKTTIDFLCMKCPQKLLGIKPYINRVGKTLYLLFVGIDHDMRDRLGLGLIQHYNTIFDNVEFESGRYYPIQFSPSSDPFVYLYYHDNKEDLNGRIIELRKAPNSSLGEWIFERFRDDRKTEKSYYGNDFRVAEINFNNYIDPFEESDLYNYNVGYFTKKANEIYSASNKFKRFVISSAIKSNFSGVKWIVDLAAGRGADLHRYQEVGVDNTLFVDRDSSAISELIQRKFEFLAFKRNNVRGRTGGASEDKHQQLQGVEYSKVLQKTSKSMTTHTLVCDLKLPHETIMKEIYNYAINPGMIDGCVCNFAIHYFCDTVENIRNFLKLVHSLLKPSGVFMFTTMRGEAVFDLLKPTGVWEVKESNMTKYSIKKLYKGDKLSATGQNISVLLPMANEMYEEPLANIDNIVKEASKLNFQVEISSSFDEYLSVFQKSSTELYKKLTENDLFYMKLHQLVTLRKMK